MHNFKYWLIKTTDYLYLPFKRFIKLQTFRYAFCGGTNALLNIIIFSVCYNLVFKYDTSFLNLPITRYAKAYTVALSFSFPIGFTLLKSIVFKESNVKAKTQVLRYTLVNLSCIIFDYLLLYLLIGYYNLPATLSQTFILMILSLYSYLCQTHFTFACKKDYF